MGAARESPAARRSRTASERGSAFRGLASLLLCACLCSAPAALRADEIADAVHETRALLADGELDAARARARLALELAHDAYPAPHPYHAIVHDDLAKIAFARGAHAEALAHADEAIAILEALGGADDSLWQLRGTRAVVLTRLGRYPEAIEVLERWHARFADAPESPGAATSARALAVALTEFDAPERALPLMEGVVEVVRGREGEASAAYRDAFGVLIDVRLGAGAHAAAQAGAHELLALEADATGEGSVATWTRLGRSLAGLSRLDEADRALERAATIRVLDDDGADSLAAAAIAYERARIAALRGDAVLAESRFDAALDGYLRSTSETHPAVLRTLHGLAMSGKNLGRFEQAERAFTRVIDAARAAYGNDHPALASYLSERALLRVNAGRPAEALADALAAHALVRRIDAPDAARAALVENILGFARQALGEHRTAIEHLRRGTARLVELRGAASSDLPPGYTAIALSYLALGETERAADYAERAVEIARKDGSNSTGRLARALGARADAARAAGRCDEAVSLVDEALRTVAGLDGPRSTLVSEAVLAKARSDRKVIAELLEVLYRCERLGTGDAAADASLLLAVQVPQLNATSGAVAALHGRRGTSEETASLIKGRQDLLDRHRARSAERRAALADGSASVERLEELRAANAIDREEIAALDARIDDELPGYLDLVSPLPLDAGTIRANLADDEALIVQLTDANRTYLVALTRDAVRSAVTPASAAALGEAVEAVRRGIDLQDVSSLRELPPFDVAAAHRLYRWLIAPFESMLADRTHLVFAFDGAMQRLPPALLLREATDAPSRASGYTRLPYLVTTHATSIVPSAGALVTLRATAPKGAAPQRFFGVGDPDFSDLGSSTTRSPAGEANEVALRVDSALLRRSFGRLAETADELRSMARLFGDEESVLLLQDEARESRVKATDLSRFGILAFATHGVMAGELAAVTEPSLVFTPPTGATADEDGLLTASEVTGLDLRADWVILSACNTASPQPSLGADGLSGLSRAFFHAGARSLLVTHWWVDSRASQILTSRTAERYAGDVRQDKAQALREAMLYLVRGEDEGPSYAHPALWAPFVLVGDRY